VKEKLIKLIDVKSIVTFLLTGTFAVLAIRGDINEREFMTVFTVVISFYFGTEIQRCVSESRK